MFCDAVAEYNICSNLSLREKNFYFPLTQDFYFNSEDINLQVCTKKKLSTKSPTFVKIFKYHLLLETLFMDQIFKN